MRIREIRIAGFKSFVDPTRVPIEGGLTGVVGPNGCGKSNLLEAVRWVMGAASAKALRADDMDSVIFAGTSGRPAREHAEVTIVLEDAGDGADTLEITRRIRRGAGSTYLINGRDARAKDIQLLFADASTGANSPALVRQGQISELIGAKPENRRRILEEAAGVAGLHARRHEADLKLKAAETNLARVDDALKDMDVQTAALRRQARQAERYRQIADELRRTEALLAARQWRDAGDALEAARAALRAAERDVAAAAEHASVSQRLALEAEAKLAPAAEEDMIAAAVTRNLDAQRIGLERDIADLDAARARRDAELKRLDAETARAERDKVDAADALARLAAETATLGDDEDDATALAAAEARATETEATRASAQARLDAAQAEAAERARKAALAAAAKRTAEERLARAEQRLASFEKDLAAAAETETARTRREAATKEAATAKSAADAAARRLRDAESALAKAEADERTARTPLEAAQSALRELEAELRALTKLVRAPQAGDHAPVLDLVRADPGYERALAAALGDDLLASLDRDAPTHWAGATVTDLPAPKGAERLSDHVSAPAALAARLALCFVVDPVKAAKLASDLAPGVRLVSRAGDLWRWDGLTRAAEAAAANAAQLEQRNRLEALTADAPAAQAQVETAEAHWRAAFTAREAAVAALKTARAAIAPAQQAAARAESARVALVAEADRLEARRTALLQQREAIDAERRDAADALAAIEPAPVTAQAPADLDDLRAACEEARHAAADARAALSALIRVRTDRTQRRQALARDTADWKRRAAAADTRAADLIAERDKLQREISRHADAPSRFAKDLETLRGQIQVAEDRRKTAADGLARVQARAREAESEARAARARHEAAEAARTAATQTEADALTRLRAAEEAAGEPYAALIERAGALMDGPLARASALDIEKRIERLKGERDAAGTVNLRAEEELAEASARSETLVREKADVEEAIAKLRYAIGRLNGEARTRLKAAFEAINAHFAALFATLFEGGEAALKLTESDDPLAAGLEIYASPPGKRLAALSLMSGGEQALTATALIFAVFLANPAPICVLDEVDAPLDDANVDRFCRMLAEMRKRTDTRFMVITHNPVTMARMDRLFGVTMGEAGVSQLVSVDLQKAAALAAA